MFSKSLLKHWKWKGIWKLSDEKPRKRLQWKRLHSVAYHLRYKKIQEWPCKEIFRIAKNCKIDTKNRQKPEFALIYVKEKRIFIIFFWNCLRTQQKVYTFALSKGKKEISNETSDGLWKETTLEKISSLTLTIVIV